MHGSNTLTVSAFYCANADIRPSQYVPIWWALYPPRKEEFEWLFNLGTKHPMIGDLMRRWVKVVGIGSDSE